MTEKFPNKEFEKEMISAMAVPNASVEFVDSLGKEFNKQIVRPKRSKLKTRFAWALITLVLGISVSMIVIGPKKVMAEIERLFSFIPGIGMVEEGEGLLILARPAEVYREGVQVRLEQVVADANHTIVIFTVENLPFASGNIFRESGKFESLQLLVWPDDQILEGNTLERRGWGTGYVTRLEFPPLPRDVNNISLFIPVLEGATKGMAQEDWLIPFDFIAPPDDFVVLPIYEIDNLEFMVEGPAEDQGISIALNRYIELEDGFLFEGQNYWTQESEFNSVFITKFIVHDSNGQDIPNIIINPDSRLNEYTRYSSPWTFEIKNKNYPNPWTIMVNHMNVWQALSDIEFAIDLGETPQIDTAYEISQKMVVGGKEIELEQFIVREAIGEYEGRYWLELKFNSELSVLGLSIKDKDVSNPMGHSHNHAGVLNIWIGYHKMPTGVRNMQIEEVNHTLEGDWRIEWEPPH